MRRAPPPISLFPAGQATAAVRTGVEFRTDVASTRSTALRPGGPAGPAGPAGPVGPAGSCPAAKSPAKQRAIPHLRRRDRVPGELRVRDGGCLQLGGADAVPRHLQHRRVARTAEGDRQRDARDDERGRGTPKRDPSHVRPPCDQWRASRRPYPAAGTTPLRPRMRGYGGYSTVTVFARFRGWSTFRPRIRAIRYASSCRGTIARTTCRNAGVFGM